MTHSKLKLMTLTALIAALCVIGSFIKVPGFITTAALDSAPAFLSVAFLPPIFSGVAGALGHLATALTSGFPLGPFHFLIAAEMFIIVFFFNILHKNGFTMFKWVFLVVANGILSPFPFYFIISPAFYLSALPSLLVATIINVIIVIVVMPMLSKVLSNRKVTQI
ncbi:ECF transporter S component [Lysinibacillus antri]|uniref:ECF transporter S component n=1 Tax=Lysinibacillus antri TaxID=2498145 RepID=A0A432LGD9_9BACI|nr:ECF transporter S component [Lysinibacillus antri]RUL57009.1 ECF transporter S component [Lysinibacillus antri]